MRTQISLEPTKHAQVKQKASRLGITMAEYIRRLVDKDLNQAHPSADPSSIFAIGDSGGSDIATENKTEVVADAISFFNAKK